jgi:nucleoid-associated protein YgaU
MASAAAVGRGESLSDIALAAAKGAIPGGPIAQAAFDVGIGAIRGHNLTDSLLKEVRSQIPGGELGKGAFDAAVAITKNLGDAAIARIRQNQTPQARQQFDAAINAHRAQKAGQDAAAIFARQVQDEQNRQFWEKAIAAKAYQLGQAKAKHRPPHVKTVHVKRTVRPANPTRPFPALGTAANRVAMHLVQNPSMRAMTVPQLASTVSGVDSRDVRKALAAFLSRFGAQDELDWRDVAEYDSIDSAARRCGVECPDDLGEWPGDTEGVEVVNLPAVSVSRTLLHSMYKRGDRNIKKALLAHGLLAHIARNTGELDGTTWTIRSGDNPWKVAQNLTGDGSRWKEIANVNPNMPVINNGTALKGWYVNRTFQVPPSWLPTLVPLPQAQVQPTAIVGRPGGPPFPAPSQYPNGYPSSTYRVKDGDTGEKVAQLITGDKTRWTELLKTNPSKASDKYGIALYTGNTITLPPSWVSAAPSPAIMPPAPPPLVIGGDPLSHTPGFTTPATPVILDTTPQTPPDFTPHTPPEAMPQPSITATTVPGSVPTPQPWPNPADPTVVGSQEQLGTLQTMLASFYRNHVDASYAVPGAVFGSTPEDLAGVWNDRTKAAFSGFEKWWNGRGNTPSLLTDGLPNSDSVAALVMQTKADFPGDAAVVPSTPAAQTTATTPVAKKKGGDAGPLLLLALPFLLG